MSEICQSCQQHKSIVHVYRPEYLESGEVELHAKHLCAMCAKVAGIKVGGDVPSFPAVVSMLGKVFLHSETGHPTKKETKEPSCPECGWTLRDFRQTSRFGCPNDYEVFGDFVEDLLERVQGTNEHSPTQTQARIARLRKDLNTAVENEDYEAAAELRDQIQELVEALEVMEESD